MKIETGCIYHIKDIFFKIINDEKLMLNHENGHSRPTYFTIKENDILWFIPLSSKVEKYKNIIKQKEQKYGDCKTIMIRKIKQKEVVILLQNMFPTLEKYIDHPHIVNGQILKSSSKVQNDIINNFKYMLSMKEEGINLFFTDIDKIKGKMLDELLIKEKA